MISTDPLAPELITAAWMNSQEPLSLAALRGKVVMVTAFQMLCPGCVSHSIPQAQAVHKAFDQNQLAVIGLHTVFEHHDAMNPGALKAFIQEYRLTFPIAVDQPRQESPIPKTMHIYKMQGTPSLMLIDHVGRIRVHQFGRMDDLHLGAAIGQLLAERNITTNAMTTLSNEKRHAGEKRQASCEPAGCSN